MREQFKSWWATLSEREQLLSLLSALALLLAVIYWGLWSPLADQLQESEIKLSRAEQTLSWVQEKTVLLQQAGAGQHKVSSKKLSLTQIINKSGKQYGIKFSRIVNKKKQLEVWIADIEFDLFIRWLTSLNNQYGVSVISTDFSKIEKAGHIKINHLLLANKAK